jgi:hypothetical protein
VAQASRLHFAGQAGRLHHKTSSTYCDAVPNA